MYFKRISAALFLSLALLGSKALASPETVLINGQGIGITLNSRGAVVTGTAAVKTKTGEEESPAGLVGIKCGDIITKIDDTNILSVEDLHRATEKIGDKAVMVEFYRSGLKMTVRLKPKKDLGGKYCLGLWAKDAASGIGTLTFYDPKTGDFGALGHGITESGAEGLLEIEGGEVFSSTIVSTQKGKKGEPGELQGIFGESDKPIGTIEKNTHCGIFGNMKLPSEDAQTAQEIKLGAKGDVRAGKAYILANVEGTKRERFEIEITKIPVFTGDKTKGMIIKITDKELLKKTGGIVRGMSGCPIVQSGRLVGAITHVFINDPQMGYGIFIEDMLSEMES